MSSWINAGTSGAQIQTPRPAYTKPIKGFVGNARPPGSANNHKFSGAVNWTGVASVPNYAATKGSGFERLGKASAIGPSGWSYSSGPSGGNFPLDHNGYPIRKFPGAINFTGVSSARGAGMSKGTGGKGVPLSQQRVQLQRVHSRLGKGNKFAKFVANYIHGHAGPHGTNSQRQIRQLMKDAGAVWKEQNGKRPRLAPEYKELIEQSILAPGPLTAFELAEDVAAPPPIVVKTESKRTTTPPKPTTKPRKVIYSAAATQRKVKQEEQKRRSSIKEEDLGWFEPEFKEPWREEQIPWNAGLKVEPGREEVPAPGVPLLLNYSPAVYTGPQQQNAQWPNAVVSADSQPANEPEIDWSLQSALILADEAHEPQSISNFPPPPSSVSVKVEPSQGQQLIALPYNFSAPEFIEVKPEEQVYAVKNELEDFSQSLQLTYSPEYLDNERAGLNRESELKAAQQFDDAQRLQQEIERETPEQKTARKRLVKPRTYDLRDAVDYTDRAKVRRQQQLEGKRARSKAVNDVLDLSVAQAEYPLGVYPVESALTQPLLLEAPKSEYDLVAEAIPPLASASDTRGRKRKVTAPLLTSGLQRERINESKEPRKRIKVLGSAEWLDFYDALDSKQKSIVNGALRDLSPEELGSVQRYVAQAFQETGRPSAISGTQFAGIRKRAQQLLTESAQRTGEGWSNINVWGKKTKGNRKSTGGDPDRFLNELIK